MLCRKYYSLSLPLSPYLSLLILTLYPSLPSVPPLFCSTNSIHLLFFLTSQVAANVCVSGLVSYTKVGVVVQLHAREKDKDTALLLAGVVTQLSSLVGAVVLFALVNYTQVFKSPFT